MYDIPSLHPVTHMFGIKLEKIIVSAHVLAENQGFSILVNLHGFYCSLAVL